MQYRLQSNYYFLMKLLRFVILNFLILAICFSCETEKTDINPEEGIIIETLEAYQELDVSYGSDTNQTFDLYLPENRTTNTKTIILVHGGGWTSGDKSSMNYIKDLLLQEIPDLAIVNINYRLADANNLAYPMQINDITSIVNHLKDKQLEYVISDKIGFIGTSAGGHLSLLWSYAFDTESKVNMVCSIVGPTNFTDPEYLNSTDPTILGLISSFGLNPTIEFLEEVSPYHQVTAGAPPTILFYGGQDPLIPESQGIDLSLKLQDLNVKEEFVFYPNEGHGWIGVNTLDTWAKLKLFTINNL
ncbi:alpha/beta hydrolase [Seonamhaeicola maritimus]|uniref:alpha/beta hydrolase n=1 Tax=Seonamhaeicola maritimus TaxID=2591822 RepID=UPI001F4F4609|nr:alpha/beta hydrolase [Seonamhaeicola maritimus]